MPAQLLSLVLRNKWPIRILAAFCVWLGMLVCSYQQPVYAVQVQEESVRFDLPITDSASLRFVLNNSNWPGVKSGLLRSSAGDISVSCTSLLAGTELIQCSGNPTQAIAYLDSHFPKGWGENSQFLTEFFDTSGRSVGTTVIYLSDNRPSVPSQVILELGSNTFVRGYDDLTLPISAQATDLNGTSLGVTFLVSCDGDIKYVDFDYTTKLELSLRLGDLSDGDHKIEIIASNQSGEVRSEATFSILTPQIESLVIDAPKSFYPAKDGFEDSLDFSVDVKTNIESELGGVGKVIVKSASGQVIKSLSLFQTGTKKVTVPGFFAGRALSGKVSIQVSFALKAQQGKTRTLFVEASPKKVVETSGSISVGAWQAKVDCGNSFKPCVRGGLLGSSGGIELYSDPIGPQSHQSTFRVKVPTGTYKWKVTLNGLRTSVPVPAFQVRSDFDKSIGWLPTRENFSGSWTSGWAVGDAQGSAGWYLESDGYGFIWVKSFTVTWVAKNLK